MARGRPVFISTHPPTLIQAASAILTKNSGMPAENERNATRHWLSHAYAQWAWKLRRGAGGRSPGRKLRQAGVGGWGGVSAGGRRAGVDTEPP